MRRKQRRTNLGVMTKSSKIRRLKETEEERIARIAVAREKKALQRSKETSDQREFRLSRDRERKRLYRAKKKSSKGEVKNTPKRRSMSSDEINLDTHDDFSIEYVNERVDDSLEPISLDRTDMCATNNINSEMNDDFLGKITVVCDNCSALIWKGESKGLCCIPGNIKLEKSPPPSGPQESFK